LNWWQALTAISNGGHRSYRCVKQRHIPAASSNDGSRLLLIRFETAIYFRKIIEKNIKKVPNAHTLHVKQPTFLL
jgi:hypothetical protein